MEKDRKSTIHGVGFVKFLFCFFFVQDFRPPKYDKVLVRALTDCGEVMLGRGTSRVLRAGDICLLSRTDAEPYILRNQMQEMSFEN